LGTVLRSAATASRTAAPEGSSNAAVFTPVSSAYRANNRAVTRIVVAVAAVLAVGADIIIEATTGLVEALSLWLSLGNALGGLRHHGA